MFAVWWEFAAVDSKCAAWSECALHGWHRTYDVPSWVWTLCQIQWWDNCSGRAAVDSLSEGFGAWWILFRVNWSSCDYRQCWEASQFVSEIENLDWGWINLLFLFKRRHCKHMSKLVVLSGLSEPLKRFWQLCKVNFSVGVCSWIQTRHLANICFSVNVNGSYMGSDRSPREVAVGRCLPEQFSLFWNQGFRWSAWLNPCSESEHDSFIDPTYLHPQFGSVNIQHWSSWFFAKLFCMSCHGSSWNKKRTFSLVVVVWDMKHGCVHKFREM